ncbi:MAG: MFS transporter [Porticoccaceae bacterium]|nr:MFS transporter [Porticoccaceae bacterium]
MPDSLSASSINLASDAEQVFFGWKNVGLLFGVYMLAVGFVYYSFNVIFPEMVTRMDWSRGDAAWGQTVHGLLYGVFVPFAAFSVNKWGARATILAGIVVLIIGCILLGTVTTSITAWIIIWGVVMSFGFAFGGVIPIQTTIAHWFDKHRASAIGLVMTAAGVGGFIAQPLFTWIMGTSGEWQMAWLFASAFAMASIVLAALIVNKPSDRGQQPDGILHGEASIQDQGAGAKIYKTNEYWSLKEAVRTPTLWLLVVLSLGGVMPLYLLVVHGVLHLRDLQFEPMEAASVLSAMLAGSACARFPIGWLGDRMEPRRILFSLFVCSIIALTLIWRAPNINLLLLAGAMFGASYGGTLVMIPAMVANYFGAQSFASINGFIFPLQIVVSSMVPVGAGYMADVSGNYDTSFVAIIGFAGVAAVCALITRPPVKAST